MEHWEQIIIEWINCLDILKEPLKNIEELQNGIFYAECLISWAKHKYNYNRENIIRKFIEDKYPSFKMNKNDRVEHIYVASLLLMHTSQETKFHIPMCTKLTHKTQIKIKTFLENILPLGKDVTKETIREVIVELEEMSRISNCGISPLKDFVISPVLRSAHSKIISEKIRELRELKCNLDIERLKNEDLENDFMNQQDKIQNLEKRLEEKSALIKTLQEKRIKPSISYFSRQKEDTLYKDYKKHIIDMENQLNKQQNEIDNLEMKENTLLETLASAQRESIQYKESLKNCERSFESLLSKIEMKDTELAEVRKDNIELRAYMEEFNKNSIMERSFEVEDNVVLKSIESLNANETLSSVIEIQLQEAREESAILHAEVDSLRSKLGIITRDYKEAIELNRDLQKKLDKVQAELNMQAELHISNTDIKNLQEKTYLIAQNENLGNLLSPKKEKFSEAEQPNIVLSTKLNNLKVDMENLNKLLGYERNDFSDLSIALAQIKLQIIEHLVYMRKLIDERNSYKFSIENYSKNFGDIPYNHQFVQIETNVSDTLTLNDLINYFDKMLQIKIEKFIEEANNSEKMREVMINLQEVKSNQDAILATQEITLKEKCLHIEEFQKQFDKFKEILSKKLEEEKSSHRELKTKLENQIHNQNKNIEELPEKLKLISAELEASTNHCCKLMDAEKECQELEDLIKNLNSTIIKTCSDFDMHQHDKLQYKCSYINNKTENILNIIKMTLHELHISQKVILHLSFTNIGLNKILAEQEIWIENSAKDKEEICSLKNKMRELEIIAQKRNEYLNNLIKNKESLKDSLQNVFASCNDSDIALISLKQKWNETLIKFQNILYTENLVCDKYKQLQVKKKILEDTICKYHIDHLEIIKSISDILWEKFLWTEKKLHVTYLYSIREEDCLNVLTNAEAYFSQEKMVIDIILEKNKMLQTDIIKCEEEIKSFTISVISYENNLKPEKIKTQSEIEKKLRNQISQLTKEKKDLENKVDNTRSRNMKLEKNLDKLRIEIKKLKSETLPKTDLEEIQSLRNELERLKEQNKQLHEEQIKSNQIAKKQLENQEKEIYALYERKLGDMKQKMKKTYTEKVAKLNSDQEKIIQEKLHNQMEVLYQKQKEEINRCSEAYIEDLSSQLQSVKEKLLIEQQQKQDALQQLRELQTKLKEMDQQMSTISPKISKLKKERVSLENTQYKATVIQEEMGHSVENIQTMKNAFKAQDKENMYLVDKENYLPTDINRLSVLQMRNAQCKPHLKSSYPAEIQFLPPTLFPLSEEDIKGNELKNSYVLNTEEQCPYEQKHTFELQQ